MIVIVTTPWVGHGYNMPAPGTVLDVPDETARELLDMNVVVRYETKIDPVPPVLKKLKKKRQSVSSQAVRRPPRKIRKNSGK